jgi:protein-tyrosine phosphatase
MSDEQRAAMRAAARRIDQVNSWLLVGGFVPAPEYGRLREAGVTHVVDLRESEELGEENSPPPPTHLEELGISRAQVPVANGHAPTLDQLTEARSWLDAQGDDATLYVHCGGGFGRACTMAVGLLVDRGTSLDDALQQVREARPEMRINDEQLEWLRSVEEHRKAT